MRDITYKDITWHDGVNSTEKQLLDLKEKYGFHELDVEDCLSIHERPKVEEYDDYLFLVIHVPYINGKSGRIQKEEVNIFVGQKFIVTLHKDNLSQIDDLSKKIRKSDDVLKENFEHGTGFFLYELMHSFFYGIFPLVDTISRDLRTIEDRLFESEEQIDLLREILNLKRNIITLRSILLPQRTVIAMLEHKNKKFVSEELALYFDDILDAIERQWSLLETAKELSEALQDTHESWLSHKTNSVVKVLTLFSVTMLPLTFLTGLYGMNVSLPFASETNVFIGIVVMMLGILMSMLAYFYKKHWL
ncbi:magnesium transporter CorA family protein [Candidatus Peregrinibacteria bacterium]|jgi:magnesium transporter|nr:magnesium transporter CorA family protein [Candidatus Peregrinibacteria bacterium]MBT3599180.1 magnesium transporter CorA family protein [Candidatus Peregrinibacteria bacterium]MBT4366893.1 magnesium transporter CorA family protein [Candidatus Peregrinibacteria bacterium]MBT4585916.1 magnesium transporter CorA family protein [Candidatus Peregrinibacteria bacterium]MBT6730687.1 magnesium transporter CorA family protein [Candidatus Peregrinibacteria bacterium]